MRIKNARDSSRRMSLTMGQRPLLAWLSIAAPFGSIDCERGESPSYTTVTRIMEFVVDFGISGVEIIKRRGHRKLVVDEDLVERIKQADHDCCDRRQSVSASEPVIQLG